MQRDQSDAELKGMCTPCAFIVPGAFPLRPLGAATSGLTSVGHRCSARPHHKGGARMLQRPDGDGPPDLATLDAARAATAAMTGPDVRVGTARLTLQPIQDEVAAGDATAARALLSLGELSAAEVVRVAHVTTSSDVDGIAVLRGVRNALPAHTGIVGRTVVKEGATRMLEVLLLAGGAACGIAYARHADPAVAMQTATRTAAAQLGSATPMFGMFAASAGSDEMQLRQGCAAALENSHVPSYGGAARSDDVERPAQLLCRAPGEGATDGDVARAGMEMDTNVVVAVLSGKVSFLMSAVVKSWMQPKYVRKPAFMVPQYTGDATEDLLVAIKFNDLTMVQRCIETDGVDVNVKWSTRQHQSPLVAAASRGRKEILQYLLEQGADPLYRNDGGFNAVMYTWRLKDFGESFVERQLALLSQFGADLDDKDVIPR